jgi:hypothetical protein
MWGMSLGLRGEEGMAIDVDVGHFTWQNHECCRSFNLTSRDMLLKQ